MIKYQVELELAIKASKIAGEILNNLKRDEIEVISSIDKDIKLRADNLSEEKIIEILNKLGYPIIAEETTTSHNLPKGKYWIVDPLDGSMNFLRNMDLCCISIALWEGLNPILGVIYNFNTNELYTGIVGGDAYLNNNKITTSNIDSIQNAIISTGFPSKMNFELGNLQNFVNYIKSFKKVRMLGSASMSLAYLSSGKVDVHYETQTMLWDVAAGLALLKAAGGEFKITNLDPGLKLDILAYNSKLPIRLDILNKKFFN